MRAENNEGTNTIRPYFCREKREGNVMVAQIFNGMSFPAFAFEIIGDFLARLTTVRAMRDVVITGVLNLCKYSFNCFFEGHIASQIEP